MPWKKMSCEEAREALHFTKKFFSHFQEDVKRFSETGEGDPDDGVNVFRTLHYLDKLYDGLPSIELSIKKAKEIMGDDFYGAECYKEVFGEEMDLHDIGRMPFTIKELIKAKERGFYLIARVPTDVKDVLDEEGFNIVGDSVFENLSGQNLDILPRWVLVQKNLGLNKILPSRIGSGPLRAFEHMYEFGCAAGDFFNVELSEDWNKVFKKYFDMTFSAAAKSEQEILEIIKEQETEMGIDHFSTSLVDEIYDFLMRSKRGNDQRFYPASKVPVATIGQSEFDDNGFLEVDFSRNLGPGGEGFETREIRLSGMSVMDLRIRFRHQIGV